jgi:hypothetical protein
MDRRGGVDRASAAGCLLNEWRADIDMRGLGKPLRPHVEESAGRYLRPALAGGERTAVPVSRAGWMSNAELFLASDTARCVTGVRWTVDAGTVIKYTNGSIATIRR